MTFNHALIRHAVNQFGFHVSELAFRLDISTHTLDRLLDGEDDPGDIRVASLARLAEHLRLPLHALFALPEQPEPEGTARPHAAGDAATVVATIYDRGSTPTLIGDLSTALEWDRDRLHAACKEADRRLRPAGLKVSRAHGEVAIVPLHDKTQQRSRLAQVHSATKGLNLSHYRAIYTLLNGGPWLEVSGNNSTRRRLVSGALINAGLLTQDRSQPSLTEAVTFGDPTLG